MTQLDERLMALAFQVREQKPWKKLYETNMFAVQLSDGQIAYCIVMGIVNEYKAVAAYIGSERFEGLRRFLQQYGKGVKPDYPADEMMRIQDCLQCVFDSKDYLTPEEEQAARACAKSNGYSFRGPNSFPHFVRFRPYYVPWPMQDDAEKQQLCEVLQAVLWLHEQVTDKDAYQRLGLRFGYNVGGNLPLICSDQGNYSIQPMEQPALQPWRYPIPVLKDEVAAAALRSRKKKGEWCAQVSMLPRPFQENSEQVPFFAFVLVVLDQYLMLQDLRPMPELMEKPEQLLQQLMVMLQNSKQLPAVIKVQDDRTAAMLTPFCQTVGITVKQVKLIPDLTEAIEGMNMSVEARYNGGDDEADDELDISPEQVQQLEMTINQMSVEEMRQYIPVDSMRFALFLAEKGLLSEITAMKLKKALN